MQREKLMEKLFVWHYYLPNVFRLIIIAILRDNFDTKENCNAQACRSQLYLVNGAL